jgi:peptidoglycan/xylan/chitin deacetylase (PgdA/CDA1 family)
LRRLAAGVVGGFGLARPLARVFGGRAAILAYHRVLDPRETDLETIEPGMYVTPDTFAEHVRLLQQRYHVVSLAELLRRLLTGEPLPWGTVALTFDDAWQDNYDHAYPVLRAAGLPATIYVPTGLIGVPQRFWFSRAAEATKILWDKRELIAATFPDEAMPPPAKFLMDLLVDNPSRRRYFIRVLAGLKPLSDEDRDVVLRFLEGVVEYEMPPRLETANWDQLRRMSRDVFEIGSHTETHPLLTRLTDAEVERELLASKQAIAQEIGVAPTSFCYPTGDANEKVARLVARAGYASAVTTEAGFADPPFNAYLLPRIGVHQDVAPDADGLALLLSGIR